MARDSSFLMLAAIGVGLLMFGRSGSSFGGGPLITLPDGRKIGPGGVIYNAQGQVVGRATPQSYAKVVAAHGKATGQSAQQTLALVKGIVGLGNDLYKTITAIFDGATRGGTTAGDAGSTAEILRDRVISDPNTAGVTGAGASDDWNAVYDEANAWTSSSTVPVPETVHVDVIGVDSSGNAVAGDGTPLTPHFDDEGLFWGFTDPMGNQVDISSAIVQLDDPISVPSVADIVTGG